MNSNDRNSTAFMRGYKAGPDATNPYGAGDAFHSQWARGHAEAGRERAAKAKKTDRIQKQRVKWGRL